MNGEMVKSGHRPLFVDTQGVTTQFVPREGPKRLEARWLNEETVGEIVQGAWNRARAMMGHGPFMTKVVWDREVLKKPAQRMKEAEKGAGKFKKRTGV